MRKVMFLASIGGTVLLTGCASSDDKRMISQWRNRPAPDFELTALDGGKVRLSDQRGHPVVLAFFAFNCPPCRAEAPHLSEIAERHKKDGLVVLAVNAWNEDHGILKQYAEQSKLNQRVLLDGESTYEKYEVPEGTIPSIFWINRAGVITDVDIGGVEGDVLAAKAKKLVAAGGP